MIYLEARTVVSLPFVDRENEVDIMELRLKGYGTIEITRATLVEGSDILIEAADGFAKIAETTEYRIAEVYLVENDFGWDLVAWLDVPDDAWFEERTIITEVENLADIYKLNAFL